MAFASQQIENLKNKLLLGSPLSLVDVAVSIGTDEATFLKFITDNDFQQVYALLHRSDAKFTIGVNASFNAKKERVEGELNLLLQEKNYNVLNQIIGCFKFNPTTQNYTTNNTIITELKGAGILQPNDYFNVTF